MILVALSAAYLLGSIPFGLIIVRAFRGEDLRQAGSGNIGATNAARTAGPAIGIATLVLDVAKGSAGYLMGARLAGEIGDSPLFLFVVAAPVIGHMFSPWLRFRGGKGVATALGVLILADPRVLLAGLGTFALAFVVGRRVSLGSLAAAVGIGVAAFVLNGWCPLTQGVLLIASLIIVRHHENIRRLLAGEEPRFGSKDRDKPSSP